MKYAEKHTYSGFPLTEQVRLSESPSRKIPAGGIILTVGATVGRRRSQKKNAHEYISGNIMR